MACPRVPLCLLLLPLLLGACAHSRALCPGEGSPAWRELTSAHFRMRTNLEGAAAGETLVQLERYRRALLLAWSETFDPPGRVDVVVLRRSSELEEFLPKPFSGVTVKRKQGPLLLLSGSGGEVLGGVWPDATSTPLHELVHHLSSFAMPQQPRWFGEGFAMYLQTVTIGDDGREVRLGEIGAPWMLRARSQGVLRLERLWQWEGLELEGEDLVQLYDSSWLWVHYLMNTHPTRFTDFQVRLAGMEPARAAFSAAFAGVDWDEEKDRLEDYRYEGRYRLIRATLPAVDARASERALEPAEVHALRAELHALALTDLPRRERAEALHAELAMARREAPAAFHTALMAATYLPDNADPLPPARALVAAHPERTEAWTLLSQRLLTEPATFEEREATLRRALELSPEDPLLLGMLGWIYVDAKQPQKALPPSARAVRLSPWNPSALYTYAAALAGTGHCAAAHAVQLQAVSALGDAAPAELRRELQGKLEAYARCAKPATQSPR